MTTQEILNSETLVSQLATALEYNVINEGDSLMLHAKQGYFSLTPASRVNGKKFQGYVECVSAATLETLLGLGETSENGQKEAEVVATWMRNQK